MGKCKKLIYFGRMQDVAFSPTEMNTPTTAIKTEGPKVTVNIIKLKGNCDKKITEGIFKALSSNDERRIFIIASTGKYSTRKLIRTTGLNVCQKNMYNTIRRPGRYIEGQRTQNNF